MNDTDWLRSSVCQASGCAEVAVRPYAVFIRDSKDPYWPALRFTPDEWKDFVAGIKAGEFDL